MLHAIKVDMSTGAVGSKSRASGKSMYDIGAAQRFQFISTEANQTWRFTETEVITIESSAPVNVTFDAVTVKCNSLLIWDTPSLNLAIVAPAPDTTVSVTVGRRG